MIKAKDESEKVYNVSNPLNTRNGSASAFIGTKYL